VIGVSTLRSTGRSAAAVLALSLTTTLSAAGIATSSASVARSEDRVEIVVRDGNGDAEGDRRVRDLAELTRVRYVVAPGGEELTVTARFARLDDRRRGGAVNQHVGVLISEVSECQNSWIVSANNAGRARVTYDDYCESAFGVARPRTLDVQGSWGRHGTLRVVVSTELFDDHDIRLRTVAQVGDGRAWDFTRFTRRVSWGVT
jgi:hypothetical protein